MRLESLTVNGVLAIGGTTTIDLRDMPPGLIAIIGPNGNGKTTLLDAAPASIHRKMPSRSGKALAQYATGRDSYIESVWAFEGRGVLKLRVALDGVKGEQKAVISQINADGSETPLSDGKVTTFDEQIANLFPPRDVLLASAVAAQNKEGSFSRIERHERQALFAKLLGLERYKQMAETAKLLASKCDSARATLAGRRDVLSRDAEPAIFTAIEADLQQRDAERHQIATRRQDLALHRLALDTERAGLLDQATRYATLQARVKALSDKAAGHMIQSGRIGGQRQDVTATAMKEAEEATTAHRKRAREIDTEITSTRGVMDRAAAIRQDAATAKTLREQISTIDLNLAVITESLDAITETHHAHQNRRQTVSTANAHLIRARVDAGTLTSVPCGGAGVYAVCAFLTRAQEATRQIPALEQQAALLRELDEAIAECETSRLTWLSKRTAATREKATKQDAWQIHNANGTMLLPAIETAEQRITDLEAERTRANEVFDATLTAIKTRLDTAMQRITIDVNAELREFDACGAALAELEIAIDEVKGASDTLTRCDADIAALGRDWDTVTATSATLDAAITELERRRDRFHTAQAQLADVAARLRTVEDDLLDYQLLTKALGKDGLPTLEIDAAGPTVSAFCNDLLATCFGSRFSVELVTQQATAKGGMKDAFELKVYDNEMGGEPRDLEDLSGGQQIIVDEALKNAIAAFVNSRNVSPLETMWRDETTGPLDSENADGYLQMLRRIREIAGLHHILFVTHNRDAANSADAQIVMEHGQARIVRPPYAEVA